MTTTTPLETSWMTMTSTSRKKSNPTRVEVKEANATAVKCIKIVALLLFCSEFPPITNEHQRSDYKREFDRDHQEYKDLQAELDAINKNLSDVDRELDELQEGSPQYLVRHPAHVFSPNDLFLEAISKDS